MATSSDAGGKPVRTGSIHGCQIAVFTGWWTLQILIPLKASWGRYCHHCTGEETKFGRGFTCLIIIRAWVHTLCSGISNPYHYLPIGCSHKLSKRQINLSSLWRVVRWRSGKMRHVLPWTLSVVENVGQESQRWCDRGLVRKVLFSKTSLPSWWTLPMWVVIPRALFLFPSEIPML